MSKDKQIEEMAKVIKSSLDGLGSGNFNFTGNEISAMFAKSLYNAGYRKASEVAREIFEELLKDITHGLEIARSTRKKFLHNIERNNIWVYHYDGEIKALEGMECLIAELKKKYTEEGK